MFNFTKVFKKELRDLNVPPRNLIRKSTYTPKQIAMQKKAEDDRLARVRKEQEEFKAKYPYGYPSVNSIVKVLTISGKPVGMITHQYPMEHTAYTNLFWVRLKKDGTLLKDVTENEVQRIK